MTYIFLRCCSLKSLDLSNFNAQSVEWVQGMFKDYISLTSQVLLQIHWIYGKYVCWMY